MKILDILSGFKVRMRRTVRERMRLPDTDPDPAEVRRGTRAERRRALMVTRKAAKRAAKRMMA